MSASASSAAVRLDRREGTEIGANSAIILQVLGVFQSAGNEKKKSSGRCRGFFFQVLVVQ